MALATGIEPVFAAPITVKSLEDSLGYASIKLTIMYFPMMITHPGLPILFQMHPTTFDIFDHAMS